MKLSLLQTTVFLGVSVNLGHTSRVSYQRHAVLIDAGEQNTVPAQIERLANRHVSQHHLSFCPNTLLQRPAPCATGTYDAPPYAP